MLSSINNTIHSMVLPFLWGHSKESLTSIGRQKFNVHRSGWPRTLENRENGEKNSLQGKIREFEILLKIREKSGNLKKSYHCKVKIFKFYSCSDVATKVGKKAGNTHISQDGGKYW